MNLKQKSILLTAIVVLTVNSLSAQINRQKLDKLFAELAVKGDFNGNVIVAKGGKVVYKQSIGYASIEDKRELNENTVFELASMGKQFTAMGIMILQEEGKIKYDKPVRKYLKDFPYSDITVRNLLNMCSGIPEYLNYSDEWPTDKIASNSDILNFFTKNTPDLNFKPNDRFEYSNTNYIYLAEITKKVSGESFSSFLKRDIFDKAEMSDTRSYTTRFATGEKIDNYAQGYNKQGDSLKRPEEIESTKYVVAASGIEGDGSIVSTGPDLIKWTQGLKTNLFVSEETLDEAYKRPTFNDGQHGDYGFGIYIGKDKIWHWGGWPGVQTSYTRYLKNDVVAIYLKNVESFNWNWIGTFEKLVNR